MFEIPESDIISVEVSRVDEEILNNRREASLYGYSPVWLDQIKLEASCVVIFRLSNGQKN